MEPPPKALPGGAALAAPAVLVAAAPRDTFFVPPLCNVRALSLLVLLGELIAAVLMLANDAIVWERFALLSLFIQWVVVVSAALTCVARPYLAPLRLSTGASGVFLIVVLVTATLSVVGEYLLGSSISWWPVLRNVIIAGVVGGIVLRFFFVQRQLQEQQESALQSRIQALQSRIRPHFLFNSMNIIASLIPVDPQAAETVVEDLAALFRASLNDAGNQVPIEDELELCRRYLRIEALRLDERLTVQWRVEPLPRGVMIPLLTLQPLLENAIYHGIQPLTAGGVIDVAVRHADGCLQVRITNPMPPLQARAERHSEGNRMALVNIRTRLEVLYGGAAVVKGAVVNGAGAEAQYILDLRYPFFADSQSSASSGAEHKA